MMFKARRAWAGVALVAAIVVWPAVVIAEDSLSAARDLYAAAAYEDALAALDRLRAGGGRVDESRAVDQYRAFCLLALGKSSEAMQAIEAVVSADPSYHPSESDVSPRVRAAFTDVRRRLLPDLAQQKYVQAKASFDRKDYRVAAESFGQLLDLFADPDLAPAAAKPPLTDLRMLALGFRDLSAQAMAPPPPPAPAPLPAAAAVTAAVTPAPPAIPDPPRRIYASSDANVLPPAAIRQELPPFNGTIYKPTLGVVEVVVDENGGVLSAAIRAPMNVVYDRQVLTAAAGWRYKPALLDGVPVKYRKFIQVALTPK
jgi:tetratricopeptide (TPR) repeat protein